MACLTVELATMICGGGCAADVYYPRIIADQSEAKPPPRVGSGSGESAGRGWVVGGLSVGPN